MDDVDESIEDAVDDQQPDVCFVIKGLYMANTHQDYASSSFESETASVHRPPKPIITKQPLQQHKSLTSSSSIIDEVEDETIKSSIASQTTASSNKSSRLTPKSSIRSEAPATKPIPVNRASHSDSPAISSLG